MSCFGASRRMAWKRIRTSAAARCWAATAKTSREIIDLLPLANRRDDSPRNRFELTPDDVRLAEKTAREKRLELLGWYHSHPDAPARPSEFDREHAWPWYSYIIVSVQKGEAARYHFVAIAGRPQRLRSGSSSRRSRTLSSSAVVRDRRQGCQ